MLVPGGETRFVHESADLGLTGFDSPQARQFFEWLIPDFQYTEAAFEIPADSMAVDVRVHNLLHSLASIAVSGGESLDLVSKVLGHHQLRITERYSY